MLSAGEAATGCCKRPIYCFMRTTQDTMSHPDNNTVSTMSVFPLLQCGQQEGMSVQALLQDTILTEQLLRAPAQMVPFAEELKVVRNYLRLTREPHPGLNASYFYHFNSFGVLGAALVSHATMMEACRFLVRYVDLTFTPFLVSFVEDGNDIYARYIDRMDLGECREFYLLRDLAFIRNLCREADPEHWTQMVASMDIAMALPAAAEQIREYFPWPLRFNADETRIHAHKALLQQPLRLGNAMTLQVMQQQCDEQLTRRQQHSWRQRVEDLLLIQPVFPDLQTVAHQLCCSERTLRRHLQQENCTFHDILGHLQQQRAINYLRLTRLPVEVIAGRLGYSETAAFSHAFKRWTGQTPSQFRQQETPP